MGLELRYCTSVVLRPQLGRERGRVLLILGNDGECVAREASCALVLFLFGNRNVPASERACMIVYKKPCVSRCRTLYSSRIDSE